MPKFVGTTLDFGEVQGHNLSDPTSPQDAATKNYVDAHIALSRTAAVDTAQGANTSLTIIEDYEIAGGVAYELAADALLEIT